MNSGGKSSVGPSPREAIAEASSFSRLLLLVPRSLSGVWTLILTLLQREPVKTVREQGILLKGQQRHTLVCFPAFRRNTLRAKVTALTGVEEPQIFPVPL